MSDKEEFEQEVSKLNDKSMLEGAKLKKDIKPIRSDLVVIGEIENPVIIYIRQNNSDITFGITFGYKPGHKPYEIHEDVVGEVLEVKITLESFNVIKKFKVDSPIKKFPEFTFENGNEDVYFIYARDLNLLGNENLNWYLSKEYEVIECWVDSLDI